MTRSSVTSTARWRSSNPKSRPSKRWRTNVTNGLGNLQPRIGDILRVVAAQSGITLDELRGPCRQRTYAYPRILAYYLCRTMTKASYPKIAREMVRDHTSVLFGYRVFPAKRI